MTESQYQYALLKDPNTGNPVSVYAGTGGLSGNMEKLSLQQAQQYVQGGLRLSGIPNFNREQFLTGNVPSSGMVDSYTNPRTGEVLRNVPLSQEQNLSNVPSNLGGASAPSNPANIVQSGNVNIPQTNYSAPSISTATSTVAGSEVGSKIEQQIADNAKQQAQLQQDNSKANTSFLQNLFGNTESRSQIQSEEEARLGIDAKQYLKDKKIKEAEINSLSKDYTDTKNAMEAEKQAASDRLATTGSISAQQSAIERKYAPTINRLAADVNFKTAQLATLNGDFQTAEALVEKYVANRTADQTQKVNQALAFQQENNDNFTKLSSIYQTAFNNYINIESKKLDQQTADAKYVGTLSINPDYAGAGIQSTDTPTQANAKAQAWILKHPTLTTDQKNSNAVANAKVQLKTGADGYTDPNVYVKVRSSSTLSPTEFDNRFGYLVNPLSRAKVGLTNTNGTESALTPTDITKGVNYLLTNKGTQDDLNKFQTDRAFQAWVLSKIQ